jgi:TusA-related sulfurtransferase
MFKQLSIVALASLVIGCATHNQHSEVLTMGKIPSNRSIDMRGKTITPFILYYAVKNLQDMQEGEILEVNTDKFEAIENDMNAWSRMTGHRLLEMETGNNYQRYFIAKVTVKKPERKLAMIISDPGLEKLLSPLGLALSAALSGTDVYLYFQGPAVRVLKKNFKAKLSGIQNTETLQFICKKRNGKGRTFASPGQIRAA